MNKLQEAFPRIQKRAAGEIPPEALQQMPPEQLPAQEAPEQPSIEQVIVVKLQAAFCAEMNSWYQYVWAIINGHGPDRGTFIDECKQHAEHELEHAYAIAAEIKKIVGVAPLGLIPFDLSQVFQSNPCPPIPEVEGNVSTAILTQQIIEAEKCAVKLYEELAELTADAYPDVQDTINGILATERDHVVDMTEIAITIGPVDGGVEEPAEQLQA